MKLKTTIRLIRYSNYLLFIALLPFIAAVLSWSNNSGLLAIELSLAALGVTLFLSRRYAINKALQTSTYPGVLYAVIEKLKLTIQLDLALSGQLLDDRYRPVYSTEQFLKDNELSADWGYVPESGRYRGQFKEDAFYFLGIPFAWGRVTDWKISYGGSRRPDAVTLFYKDEKGNDREMAIALSLLNIGEVDMLILLAHFKGRYGSTNNQTALRD